MVALAKEKNLRYGINLNHRFTPAALRAKEWVNAGRLGELNIINMTMWINNPNETSPWFHIRALHPHSLDVMRYFAGDVEKVQAFFKKGSGDGPMEARVLVERAGQPAVQERHHRPPDRQLRRRRQLRPGDARSGRLRRRALCCSMPAST